MNAEAIVPFNVDVATYVGDGNDGCYYQTALGERGWYRRDARRAYLAFADAREHLRLLQNLA